jgi:hypothetical protein
MMFGSAEFVAVYRETWITPIKRLHSVENPLLDLDNRLAASWLMG